MDRSHTALILDGSLGHGCVALLALSGPRSGDLVVAESGEPQRSHLERIATLLPSEASRAELSAIVVGVGPGSYTGIRAASAAAAGVAGEVAAQPEMIKEKKEDGKEVAVASKDGDKKSDKKADEKKPAEKKK